MSLPDFPPAPFEVEDQLKRMLASPRFQNAFNPSAFLRLVVSRAQAGKKTPGRVVAKTLFKDKFVKLVSNDVRVTASNLRKTLEKYYAREGREDIVIISLPTPTKDKSVKSPEGEAYTPSFSYNPNLELFIQLRVAYRFLEGWTYRDYAHAFRIFVDIWNGESGHLGAGLGLTEVLCKFADRNWENPSQLEPFAASTSILEKLQPRAGNYWRFWAVSAFVEKVLGEDDRAGQAFEKALALDRNQTESYIPYIQFLFEIKRTQEAIALANRYIYDRMEDSDAHTHLGIFLTTAGEVQDGCNQLQQALLLDPGHCGAHEFLAVVHFINGDSDDFIRHMRILRTLCDDLSFDLTVRFFQKYEEQHKRIGWTTKLLPSGA